MILFEIVFSASRVFPKYREKIIFLAPPVSPSKTIKDMMARTEEGIVWSAILFKNGIALPKQKVAANRKSHLNCRLEVLDQSFYNRFKLDLATLW